MTTVANDSMTCAAAHSAAPRDDVQRLSRFRFSRTKAVARLKRNSLHKLCYATCIPNIYEQQFYNMFMRNNVNALFRSLARTQVCVFL